MSTEEQHQDQDQVQDNSKDKLAEDLEKAAAFAGIKEGIPRIEIVRRTGRAIEEFDPPMQIINGNIKAPFEYYSKRKDTKWFNRDMATLEVDYETMALKYETEPIQRRGVRVTGAIKLLPHIHELCLTDFGRTRWDNLGFVRLLKKLRPYFMDQKECLDLVNTIQNIDVRVDTKLKKEENQRGIKADSYKHVAKADLPEAVLLETPLFVGQPDDKVTLALELYYDFDPKISGLQYWFESRDFEEKIIPMVQELMDNEVAHFKNRIPVIYT